MDNKIIVTHNAGFYSNCSIRLKHIVDFYNKNKIYPIVDSSSQWIYYKDNPDVDITNIFFKDNNTEFKELDHISYDEEKEDQFSQYNELDYDNINILIEKYFKPSDEIIFITNTLIKNYNIDINKTIAVCYRGNDKHKETNVPSYNDMLVKITEIKNKYPDYKLLIQSDEAEFYNFILGKYPDSIYFNEILKMGQNHNTAIQYHIPIGNRVNQAKIFHSILLIISKCDKVILNSGNVGMWICLNRGNFNGVYQYLNHKEYIYNEYNRNYKKLENNWIE